MSAMTKLLRNLSVKAVCSTNGDFIYD